jgi:hypothetical protein
MVGGRTLRGAGPHGCRAHPGRGRIEIRRHDPVRLGLAGVSCLALLVTFAAAYNMQRREQGVHQLAQFVFLRRLAQIYRTLADEPRGIDAVLARH